MKVIETNLEKCSNEDLCSRLEKSVKQLNEI